MTSAAPSVWAIVLTYGGAEDITGVCIDSLLAQDYPALTVLLVDNASFDGSGERLRDRFSQVRYLNTGANLGYTGGNNRGMQFALAEQAEYLLVVNNDTVLEPDCVSLLAESARAADRVGAIGPKILYYEDPTRIWYAGGDFSFMRSMAVHRLELQQDDPTESKRLDDITFVTGCCFLMPADVAKAVGGFREDFFMYCEDLELSLRLMRAGYRLYYQPAARMLHRHPARRPNSTPVQILQRDRNRRRIARQHFSLPQRVAFALWFYPSRLVRLGQYAARGEWAHARAIVSGAVAR